MREYGFISYSLDLFNQMLELNVFLCENQSYVKLTNNHVCIDKSKHIRIKYQYIRGMVHKGESRL